MARRRTQTEAPEAEAPKTETPKSLGDCTTSAERMAVLRGNVASERQDVKNAKVAWKEAKEALAAAKKAVDPGNDDSLLAAAQAEQAEVAAAKSVTSAEKNVKATEKKLEIEAGKQRAVKEAQAETEAFTKAIKNDGKEIVTRLEKAQKYEAQADDHRLAAALKMAEVEGKFAEARPKGITFRKWCEGQNVVTPDVRGRSWENVRKLLAVGKADNPQQALTDMREGNKAAVAKHRDKSGKPGGNEGGSTGSTETPFQRIESALGSMPEEMAANAVKSIADSRGLKVVAKDAPVETPVTQDAVAQAQDAVRRMTSNEFDAFIDWLEEFEAPSPVPERTPETSDDPLDIPASLRRS